MAHDIFISYSSGDKPTADAVCATLESRGIRCWIAPRDVLPGDEYAAALVSALRESRAMVLVFSSGSNQSQQVLREVERAVSRGLPIIPLRIENVPPSAAMEYYISSRHWLDALTPPLEQHLLQLAHTIELLFSRAPGPLVALHPMQAVKPIPAASAPQTPAMSDITAPPQAAPSAAPPIAPLIASEPLPTSSDSKAHVGRSPVAKRVTILAIALALAVVAILFVRHYRPAYRTLISGTESVNSMAFSPDGRLLASGCSDGTVKVWEVSTGRFLSSTGPFQSALIDTVAFSPDSRFLATGGGSVVQILIASTGELTRDWDTKEWYRQIRSVAFGPDGRVVAFGDSGSDRNVNIWNWTYGMPEPQGSISRRGQAYSVAFSANDRALAAGFGDGHVTLETNYDGNSGFLANLSDGADTPISSIAFSPSGGQLAAGKWSGDVDLWNWREESEIYVLKSHTQPVYSVAVSNDGRWIAAGGGSYNCGSPSCSSVTIWEFDTGRERRTIYTSEAVTSVAFSPDSKWLGFGGRDGAIHLWRINALTGSWLSRILMSH
ncbi:MAG: TIR domain-containing protein [Candidatus Acidiferrales bacterium]